MTYEACPLDRAHVDARFPCGHRVHTDMTLGGAMASPPEHARTDAGTP